VGTPVAGRGRAELEGLIGFFVNTLVLRGRVGAGMSFREAVREAREVCLGAYGHQEVPFERVVEELRPERDVSRTPLFQVFFNLRNFADSGLHLPGLTLETLSLAAPEEHDEIRSNFDITLYAIEDGRELRLVAVYNVDLFAAETIVRMLGHLQTLLEGAVAQPDQHLSDIPITTAEERAWLSADFTKELDEE
jgi:non-ribosomal peptide synthetase component F